MLKEIIFQKNPLNLKIYLRLIPLKKWDEELDIGLKGAFICSQIFGSEMAKKKMV